MPSWGELLQELQPHTNEAGEIVPALSFDELRTKYIALLSKNGAECYHLLLWVAKAWENSKYRY